ncbi:hypothetical protein [Halorussus salinisoli]|uniref:hypothetical protein n=1 Tax=Halorussus salinisoli TaxID=2558242 RepID=UPI0014859607|nr:hypothetical protein [Halorussus salinisoli]
MAKREDGRCGKDRFELVDFGCPDQPMKSHLDVRRLFGDSLNCGGGNSLWYNMTQADETLVEALITDGGTISPTEAAEETGYTYRTIRESISRLEGFIRHTYGEIEIASKAMRDKMLRRIHAAEHEFKDTIGNTAMEIADLANERDRGPWSRWKRDYNVTFREADDCRKLLKIRYNSDDRQELREVLQSGVNAYREVFGETVAGIHAMVEFADETRERIRDLTAQLNARTSATAVAEEARRWENVKIESVDWDAWAKQERQRATR